MNERIVDLAFEVMSSYPGVDWNELYLMLFKRSYKEGSKELATQAFYKIVIEAIRTNNTWAIEELIDQEENLPAMNDLKLILFAKDVIKAISPKSSKRSPEKYFEQKYNFKHSFKFEFREGSQYRLCACCNHFKLSCNEIQNFPLVNEEVYIREKFHIALSQEQIHKRTFIIKRLLCELVDKTPDLSLFFELWIIAEIHGIHLEPTSFIDNLGGKILEDKYFHSFLTIIKYRHHEHDSMIDDVSELLLIREKYDLAHYLNAKLSTPYVRLFKALGSALNSEGSEYGMIIFLKNVTHSIKHEKVAND